MFLPRYMWRFHWKGIGLEMLFCKLLLCSTANLEFLAVWTLFYFLQHQFQWLWWVTNKSAFYSWTSRSSPIFIIINNAMNSLIDRPSYKVLTFPWDELLGHRNTGVLQKVHRQWNYNMFILVPKFWSPCIVFSSYAFYELFEDPSCT